MKFAEITKKIKAHKDEIAKEIKVRPSTVVKWCDEPQRFLNVGIEEICAISIIIGVHPNDFLKILENEEIDYI